VKSVSECENRLINADSTRKRGSGSDAGGSRSCLAAAASPRTATQQPPPPAAAASVAMPLLLLSFKAAAWSLGYRRLSLR
jgi:hypothetical protein